MDSNAGGPPPLILIVDDHPDAREMIAAAVGFGGYRTATAAGGAEALRIVDAMPPALVLLDVSMPGVDGFDVLARLQREDGRTRVPVVMLTAFNSIEVRCKALALGAREVLVKGKSGIDEVLACIGRHAAA